MPAIVRFRTVVPTQSHVQLWRYIQKPTLGAMTIARTEASPQYAIPSARRVAGSTPVMYAAEADSSDDHTMPCTTTRASSTR